MHPADRGLDDLAVHPRLLSCACKLDLFVFVGDDDLFGEPRNIMPSPFAPGLSFVR